MTQLFNNATKATSATSTALTGDNTLNVGGTFDGAIVYVSLNPAAGTGYTKGYDEPFYISIDAESGTTLSLNIEGGGANTAIDADLLGSHS